MVQKEEIKINGSKSLKNKLQRKKYSYKNKRKSHPQKRNDKLPDRLETLLKIARESVDLDDFRKKLREIRHEDR